MNVETIEARACRVIAEQMGMGPEEVTPESSFEKIGCDSLDFVEITMALEEEFEVQIEDEAWEPVWTKDVAAAIELIKSRREVRA